MAIALALMMLLSLMPAAFASGDVATDVPEEGTVPAAPAAESAPVGEPVPTPEATEPTPTPMPEDPTPTPEAQSAPMADPTPAPVPEAATDPAPTEEPCTLTEGCTLEAGHEGNCITADAEPEDEVAEAVNAFLDAIAAITLPEDLSTLAPEGIEELRAQIDMVLSMPMVLAEPGTPAEADDVLKKLQDAIDELKNTKDDIDNFLKTHIVYNVDLKEWYEALDLAVTEAEDNNTLVLLADCTTNGFNLRKNLNIVGNGIINTITFNGQGIALWGKALTFTNCNIVMTGIGSTPYAEWNLMSICASNGSCISLYSSSMTLNGTGTSGKHAIYFTGNSMFNLDSSSVTISNYDEDALEWNGGDSASYAFNLSNHSSFTATNNRSGLAGTFTVTCDASTMNVNNNRGNGSNGSSFNIKNDSVVNFNENGAHGISATNCAIANSTVNTNKNGANGLHVGQTLEVTKSAVTITGNECSISSNWAIPGALYLGGNASIDADSALTITGNKGSGIYHKAGGTLTIAPAASVTIMTNTAEKLGLGGGVYINGTASFPAGVNLYNNHASTAGDDIYSTGTITFGATGDNWKLDGMPDCEGAYHDIDGWYDDSDSSRWLADTDDTTKQHIAKIDAGTYTSPLALKAAHGIIPVTVTVNKVWVDNDNSAGKRPSSVTIYLYADGKQVKTMYITANGGWVGTFENLPAYNDSGAETKYEIRERDVFGYRNSITTTDNGFTVTNTYSPTSYSGTGIPSTGDDSNLALWGIVMAVSLVAGAAALLITAKKRKDDAK